MVRGFLIVVFLFLLFTQHSFAMKRNFFLPDGLATLTGTIQDKRLNTLDIYDEKNKDIKSFIYTGNSDDFKKGDRIRIYYTWQTNIIQDIRPMTRLEYHSNGQNLGDIYRSK
jgi:hypothetical protein